MRDFQPPPSRPIDPTNRGSSGSRAIWSLLIPAIGIGMAVQNPETPYIVFLGLALLCGFGGGNFASSMSNISFFIPKSYGSSIALTGGPQAALWGFFIFYVTCVAITWWVYTRPGGVLHDIERGSPKEAATSMA